MPLPRTGSRTVRPTVTRVASNDDTGSNVRVVVRCRGRNDREIKAKSVVVVEVSGEKGIAVSTGSPDQPVVKNFNVDSVFGSESDQTMIFDQVISPIVDDFLNGINCTVFAYGQTGTGKTYTMSGDCSLNGGTISVEAGVIPRVLFKIFSDLISKDVDYTVSCSFLELYNEEMKDLLANDENKKLRLFDDSVKKSPTLQGLTEQTVTSATAAIKCLQRGLDSRQVGSTKMNDHSSRSHTIFTVYTAVSSGDGTVVRSKVNLVDLAGSENIGKSGAADKRAREAGMINQSLLTLGRVINALVDKSTHIPYRESKLTRLLQDSLGGRTKTCIIAAISPAFINIEETLSTLEYASRAKNIKNRPQIVNPISKKAFLKEVGEETEKLQLDLIATRKKNGIYLDENNYKDLLAEQQSLQIQVRDQQRRLSIIDTQLKDSRIQTENLKLDLQQKTQELKNTTKSLNDTVNSLVSTQNSLRTTSDSLQKEIALRKAHAGTEDELHAIGNDLILSLESSLADIDVLYQRLHSKSEVEKRVRTTLSKSSKSIQLEIDLLRSNFQQTNDRYRQNTKSLSVKVQDMLKADGQRLVDILQYLNDGLTNLDVLNDKLVSATGKSNSDLNGVFAGVTEIKENLKLKVIENLKDLQSFTSDIQTSIDEEIEKFQAGIIESFSKIIAQAKVVWDSQMKLADSQRLKVVELTDKLNEVTKQKLQVQKQLDELSISTKNRMEIASEKKHTLLLSINKLINEYSDSQINVPANETFSQLNEMNNGLSTIFRGTDVTQLHQVFEDYQSYGQSVVDSNRYLESQLGGILVSAQTNGSSIGQVGEKFKENAAKILESSISGSLDDLEETLLKVNEKRQEHDNLVKAGVDDFFKEIKHTFSYTEQNLAKVQQSFDNWDGSEMMAHENNLASDNKNIYKSLDRVNSSIASLEAINSEYEKETDEIPAKRNIEFSRILPQTRPRLDSDRQPLTELNQTENVVEISPLKRTSSVNNLLKGSLSVSSPLKRPLSVNMDTKNERPNKILRTRRRNYERTV